MAVGQTVAAHNQLASILQLERVRWHAVGLMNVQLQTELLRARQATNAATASAHEQVCGPLHCAGGRTCGPASLADVGRMQEPALSQSSRPSSHLQRR